MLGFVAIGLFSAPRSPSNTPLGLEKARCVSRDLVLPLQKILQKFPNDRIGHWLKRANSADPHEGSLWIVSNPARTMVEPGSKGLPVKQCYSFTYRSPYHDSKRAQRHWGGAVIFALVSLGRRILLLF